MKLSTVKHRADNIPVLKDEPLGMFHSRMKRDLRVGEKDGEAIVGAVFRTGGKRRAEDCEGCTALILDIDNGVTNPENYLKLFPYKGVAYSSHSSTEDFPRFRVVLPFPPGVIITLDEWRQIWDWANAKDPVLDKKGRDPVHLYYLPRVPDEDSLDHAWIKALQGEDLNPREILKTLSRPGKKRKTRYYGDASFDEASKVVTALPDKHAEDRGSWISVGMALHELEQGSDRCLELWVAFSKQSSKYKDGECEQKWRGFTQRDDGTTIGTLKRWLSEDGIKLDDALAQKSDGRPVNRLAEAILKKHSIMTTREGMLFEYNGRMWERIFDSMVEKYAMDIDGRFHTKQSRRGEIADFVRTVTVRPGEIKWNSIGDQEVPLHDCILDVHSGHTRGHVEDDYLDRCLEWTWDPKAECPIWMKCLERWFPNDQKSIESLQEFFGYMLLPHARFKKALICFGPSDTGKSVVGHVARMMCEPYVCSIPLAMMGDPRAIAPIQGKALNLVSELKAGAMIADGGFKQLVSTGEAVQIDQKYERAIMYVPHACHMILTNTLPRVNDSTSATFNRMLILNMNVVIPIKEQDPGLEDAIRREMWGVVRWAAQGARRLVAQKGFSILESSERQVSTYERDQNPVAEFFDGQTVPDEDAYIRLDDFRYKFDEWLGHGQRKLSPHMMGRWLSRLGASVEKHNIGGKRVRVIRQRRLVYEKPGSNSNF